MKVTDQMVRVKDLVDEYEAYCTEHNLSHISADEHNLEELSFEDARYIKDFIKRWDQVTRVEAEHNRKSLDWEAWHSGGGIWLWLTSDAPKALILSDEVLCVLKEGIHITWYLTIDDNEDMVETYISMGPKDTVVKVCEELVTAGLEDYIFDIIKKWREIQ